METAGNTVSEIVPRFRVLGPVEVRDCAGNVVALPGSRQRLLVACLVAHAGRVVTAERLVECLWGEGQPSDPVAALQSQVSRLRQRLGPGAGLETVGSGYRLRVGEDDLDAALFERLLAQARVLHDPGLALGVLDSALGLWRGRAYGEYAAEPDVAGVAEHLEGLRISAREQRVALLLALGRPEEAAAGAAVLVREQPLHEPAVNMLVEGLHEAGRVGEALAEYESYRVRLAEELGVDPGPELRNLHLGILRGDADLSRARAVLPRPMTSYVGRDDELRQVTDDVRDGRLVTLTGPGGVGKTRLAIEVANRLSEELPDGVWFCDLAVVADAEAVPAAVASTLAIQRRHNRSISERLVEVMGGRRALLVVDNCEHVRDAAALLVQQVVEHTAKVNVLATSREALGVPGEHRVVVEPLGEGDAARLFADRARAARPGLTLSADDDVGAVLRICREVASLPLGVELAAARVAARTPVEIASDLVGRVDRLAAPRSGLARHQSVAAVVDWSLDRLSEPEQELAEHLGVFSGGCTAESAAAVLGRDVGESADLLVGLVDRSIVIARPLRGHTRYPVLEPVRARAEQRLQQRGQLPAARRAHATYFAALTARASVGMRTSEAANWVQTLDDEFANLRAACRWSLETDGGHMALELLAPLQFYAWSRMPAELYEWAERACAAPAASEHPGLPAVLALAALAACRRGDIAHAARLADQATDTALSPGATAQAFRASGFIPFFEGRLQEAIDRFDVARAAAHHAGDTFSELLSEADIAMVRAFGGDDTAAAAADDVCARAEALGTPWMVAYACYVAAESRLRGSPREALPLLRRAVNLARAAGHRYIAATAGLSATSMEVRHGDPTAVLRDLNRVLDEWQRDGSWNPTWVALQLCVDVFIRLSEDEPAAQLIGAMRSSPTAAVLRGPGAKQLARAEAVLGSRLASYETFVTRGAGLGDDGAVDLARHTLSSLMQSSSSTAIRH